MRRFAWMMGPLRDQAGDGDGGGGGGDDNKPLTKADVVKLVNDTVNGSLSRVEKETKNRFTKLDESLKTLLEKIDGGNKGGTGDGNNRDDDNNDDDNDDTKSKSKSKVDPKVLAQLENERKERKRLQDSIEELKRTNAERERIAEEKERRADINAAMSKFSFASDSTREMAFDYFSGKVKRSEDGALIAAGKSGDVPFDHFIKEYLEANPNLLAPKPGGSGAQGGGPARPGTVDSATIRPGMTPEERKKAAAAVAAFYQRA